MTNLSYSAKLSSDVHHIFGLATGVQTFLSLCPESTFDRASVKLLLDDIWCLHFNMECHSQSENCQFSADEAQNLFSMLNTAKLSLERIL